MAQTDDRKQLYPPLSVVLHEQYRAVAALARDNPALTGYANDVLDYHLRAQDLERLLADAPDKEAQRQELEADLAEAQEERAFLVCAVRALVEGGAKTGIHSALAAADALDRVRERCRELGYAEKGSTGVVFLALDALEDAVAKTAPPKTYRAPDELGRAYEDAPPILINHIEQLKAEIMRGRTAYAELKERTYRAQAVPAGEDA